MNSNLQVSINNDYAMLEKIATDNHSLDDIRSLTSSKVTDQLKVFLVAQAKRELKRVITLLKFLDDLEAHFIQKATEEMDSDNLTLRQFNEVISTITSLLESSNSIITRVLKDESLMTILNTTIYTSKEATVSSVVSMLGDPQSRERVRAVLNQTITLIDANSSKTTDSDLVEVTEND